VRQRVAGKNSGAEAMDKAGQVSNGQMMVKTRRCR